MFGHSTREGARAGYCSNPYGLKNCNTKCLFLLARTLRPGTTRESVLNQLIDKEVTKKMFLKSIKFCMAAMLGSLLIMSVAAQDPVATKKTVVQNPDGSYTVIEYPVGKDVIVDLTPVTTVTGSKGVAHVIRSADGTKVMFDLSAIPAGTTNMYAYAVDPAGVPTLLGPLTVTDGIAKAEFSTPLNQFMIVVSPNEGLTAIDTATPIFYRSSIPKGYAVVPRRTSTDRVVAVGPAVVSREPGMYEVPLLNVGTFPDTEKEVKLKFGGELSGLEAKAYIDREKGVTKIRMHFDDMKKVPPKKIFTLWTYSPDGQYTRLGRVIASGKRDEAEIKSETTLTDFGLFITAEDAEVTVPTSKIYSVFTVPSLN